MHGLSGRLRGPELATMRCNAAPALAREVRAKHGGLDVPPSCVHADVERVPISRTANSPRKLARKQTMTRKLLLLPLVLGGFMLGACGTDETPPPKPADAPAAKPADAVPPKVDAPTDATKK